MEGLAAERIFEEWEKLILRGRTPSRGLGFLHECGWIRHFPELEALAGCPQDEEWHPEGDVWTHTLWVMDAFANERIDDEWEDLVVGFACLCHDLGKPHTTTFDDDGRIRTLGHEKSGVEPTRNLLGRMTNQATLIEAVESLVTRHMRPTDLFKSEASDAAVRRLARRVGRIDRLVRVARADQQGRAGDRSAEFPAGDWLLERAASLDVVDSGPKPIVKGRHLIEFGLDPGPHFGPILDACFEAQLDGVFSALEDGRDFAERLISRSL